MQTSRLRTSNEMEATSKVDSIGFNKSSSSLSKSQRHCQTLNCGAYTFRYSRKGPKKLDRVLFFFAYFAYFAVKKDIFSQKRT
jgi:hypothetical protein